MDVLYVLLSFTVVRMARWSTVCAVIKLGHGEMFTFERDCNFLVCSLRSGLPSDAIPHIHAN